MDPADHLMVRIYRLLLHAYPAEFRRRFGPQMVVAFAELAAARRAMGPMATLALLLQTMKDVAVNAVAEHRTQWLRRRVYLTVHGRHPRRGQLLDGVLSDTRFAWRSLAARPGLVAAVVLTLTVGTGAATAIFSVADAVLLRPLPFPDDRRLVIVAERQPANPISGASVPAFLDWQALPALSGLAMFDLQSATFNGGVEPERMDGAMVSPAFFQVLGVPSALGRTFDANAPLFDADRKMVIGHALWMRHFGGDPTVVGRQVTLDARPYTIVGVMPRGFAYPGGTAFWSSLDPDMARITGMRELRFLRTIGRLAPGATIPQLQAQLDEVARRREPELAAAERGWTPAVQTLREHTIGAVRRPLALVLGAVLLLTVVGGCNAAAMLLARGAGRSREIAIRAAVGASRGRIVRQLLLESGMIAAGAAALGALVAWSLLGTIAALSLGQVPRIDALEINGRVLAFTAAFTLLLGALLGVAPAIALSRVKPAQAINTPRAVSGSRRSSRGLRLLVVVECAMALVILAGGGLLINSFIRLTRVDPGVDPAGVLIAKVNVPVTPQWQGDAARRRFHAELLDRVARLPNVRSAGIANRLPLSQLRGGAPAGTPQEPAKLPRTPANITSEGYFAAVGARLVAGRVFTANDDEKAPRVAVVNEMLAAALWPGKDAVGKTLVYRHYTGPVTATVIGVVAPIRYDSLASDFKPELFATFRQTSVVPMQLVVRTAGDPMDAVAAIRTHLRQSDPTGTVTLDGISTLDRQLASTTARPRFFAALLGAFAAAALLLSAFGIHGVLSFWTEQRQQEFGVRVALGATPAELYRQVVGQGAVLAVTGAAIGLAIAVAASRLVAGLLFGIEASDVATYLAVSWLLLVAAIAACIPAARRAASVDPVQMLRAG